MSTPLSNLASMLRAQHAEGDDAVVLSRADVETLLDLFTDFEAAATELRVDLSEAPAGSLPAKLLAANILLRRERDRFRARAVDAEMHRAP